MNNDSSEMTIVAFAVIDTNIIIGSLLGNKPSYTKDVMKCVENGNIIVLFDDRILNEYEEVLRRYFSDEIVNEKMLLILEHGYLVTDIQKTTAFFKDQDDIPFFEIKESARELDPYLITKNEKDFPPKSTILPVAVMQVLKYLDSFIIKDKEKYLDSINNLLHNLDKQKYVIGKNTEYIQKYQSRNPTGGNSDSDDWMGLD